MKLSDLRKHKKILIAVICALAATAMGALFLQPKAELEDDIIWREYPVKLGTITASLDGSGLLEATGIHHSFDVDLKIDQILVEAGQEVKTGDTLVTYSKTALQEKIDELTASLQAAQRALEDAQNNKRKMQLEGMTCSVKFIQKRVENVLTLANKAITLTDGKQTVIVQMADGSHEEREIKTGFSYGRTSEVTSGLSAGEIVVVAG